MGPDHHRKEPTLKLFFALFAFIAAFGPSARASELLVGLDSVSVTPDKPVALGGQAFIRISKEVHDPVTATALAIEGIEANGTRDQAIMISCDCPGREGIVELVRERAKGMLPGFDLNKLLLNCTHTHTAPETDEALYAVSKIPGIMQPAQYREFMVGRLAQAAVNAWSKRAPASMSFGLGWAVVARNRRVVYQDGHASMYGSTNQKTFERIEGYEDHAVQSMFFWSKEKKLIGIMVDVACPSQQVDSEYYISADFWDDVRKELRKRYGEGVNIYAIAGAAGDQAPRPMYRQAAEQRMADKLGMTATQVLGRRIAHAVDEAFEVAKNDLQADVPFRHRVELLKLPRRMVTEAEAENARSETARFASSNDQEKGFWMYFHKQVLDRWESQRTEPSYPVEAHILRIGDVALASSPFELFTDYGVGIEAQSRATQTFVMQLTCGYGGYLPTTRAVNGGSYSTNVQSNQVGPEGGRLLVSRTVEVINGMFPERSTISQGALSADIVVNWKKITATSKTNVSIQVCVEAPLRRGSKIHDPLFAALKNLNVPYARLQPWYPYPRLAVAELEPGQWDFTLMDQVMEDFMKSSAPHPVVMNISTIPQWMFKTPNPVTYPKDPDEIDWAYEQGSELRDPSGKEVADYFERVARWYIKGGFEDEGGRKHHSGHSYRFAYWEVLNEPDYEHHMTPEQYTALYDLIVQALRKVDPTMKFMGPGLAGALYYEPRWIAYFLDPKNHKPDIPIDTLSFHFYASPNSNEPIEAMQYTYFNQVDEHMRVIRYVDQLRKMLSPATGLAVNESGSIPVAWGDANNGKLATKIPANFWNLSGAVFAYFYANAAQLGVDMIHGAELIDYPDQVAGANLVDWETGKPKPAYRVLKLLADSFKPGDKLVETQVRVNLPKQYDTAPPRDFVFAQAFSGAEGDSKILLVNKRNHEVAVALQGATGGTVALVAGDEEAVPVRLQGGELTLPAFGVAVVKF